MLTKIQPKIDSEDNWKTANTSVFNGSFSTFVETKNEPYIDDQGIWYPCVEYTPEWLATDYKLLISKEMFIEAYNKWIKGE